VFDELCQVQQGVLTRRQALECGVTRGQLAAHLRGGRWQRLLPRVYATFTGPPPRSAHLWAVVLWAGRGAVLSHETAAELAGFCDEPASIVHVTIPADRRVRTVPGVVVHHAPVTRAHPTRLPPRTRTEETVLDLVRQARSLEQALAWLTRACGRRITTADRLVVALAQRARIRWRAEIRAALGHIAAGCHSPLELRYLREVERCHRLPRGERQVVRLRPGGGGRWYFA